MNIIYKGFIFILLVLSFPVVSAIGICVAVMSGLPVLFKQKRVGLGGRVFTMYKFRTMKRGAEQEQRALRRQNEANGPVFKIHNDPRFTPVGRFLSHTGLDELPQLMNVFRGDMALIGPRPLPVAEAGKLKVWQKERNMIKPGIISPWILNGYHRQPFDTWIKSDLRYAKHKNFTYDCLLIGKTMMLLARLFIREIL